MRKRILIPLGVITALLVLAVVTLPWWLGGVVRHYGDRYGVAFSSYTNVGYGRWAFEDVKWSDAGITVAVARVEGPHPLAYWWLKNNASAVVVDGLIVNVDTDQQVPTEGEGVITGPYSLVREFYRIKHMLPPLPPLELPTGSITIDGEPTLSLNGVVLNAYNLAISKVSFAEHDATIELQLNDQFTGRWSDGMKGEFLKMEIRGLGKNWDLKGTMSDHRTQVELEGQWLDQKFSAAANFRVGDRWIPDNARIQAENWRLPATELGLGDYYQTIGGNALVNWVDGRFNHVSLQLEGQPLEDGKYPALAINMLGSGNLESAEIRQLEITIPGLSLSANEPFEISRESANEGATSELTLRADLAVLPMFEGTGKLEGMLKLTTRRDDWPLVDFALNGNGLGYRDFPVLSGDMRGRAAWPNWEIDTLRVEDKSGSVVRLSGTGNGVERRVEAGQWEATVRAESLTRWWDQAAVEMSEIRTKGIFAGTVDAIEHEGRVTVESAKLAKLNPVAINAEWKGLGEIAEVSATLVAREGSLELAGTLRADSFVANLMELRHAGELVLAATQPATFAWQETASLSEVAVNGPGLQGRIDRLTRLDGRAGVEAKEPSFEWVRDWTSEAFTIPKIETLSLSADWDQGPVRFTGDLRGRVSLDEIGEVRVAITASGGADGVQVDRLELGQNDRMFAQVEGHFPATFNFTAETILAIDEAAAMDLKVLVGPNPAFWKAVGASQHVTVSRPDIAVTVNGSWTVPTATGSVAVGKLSVGAELTGQDWPEVTDLAMTLRADLEGLRIENGRASVEGQDVRWSGRLPVGEAGWERLRATPLDYLREQGTGRIDVPQANLATVAKFVPDYLVPIGEVSLALIFSPGAKIDGHLRLSDAVSRPLGPWGALQAIEADILFEGREIRVNRLKALMGGQPLSIAGRAEWQGGKRPELDLTLSGTNLPIVRQTGMLLRGDLNLHVTSDEAGAGRVGGVVNLHDGLMLADVRSLVPTGGGERRESRPPYFSVTVEPFASWELDLAVKGQRFMRLRTPVLTGEASIDIALSGTLRNPRARGDITLERGEVKLPFARFEVDEGRASLTEAQPYQPQLSFTGTGKRFGYDLEMELTGSASAPQLRLSSEPSLPAADVVLLVMAGVAPQDEITYTQGERAMKLGMYFGQEVVSDLLGLEGDGSLSLSTGERLSRRGKETYRVNYSLSERWEVTGEYDEFDHYNAGLKWRWLPAPKKPESAEAEEVIDVSP